MHKMPYEILPFYTTAIGSWNKKCYLPIMGPANGSIVEKSNHVRAASFHVHRCRLHLPHGLASECIQATMQMPISITFLVN